MSKSSQYNDFYTTLHSLIFANSSLDSIAELVFINRYCNGLCIAIAKKFKISKEDLMAELILNILNNTLLEPVLTKQCAFNGRVFTYEVMNIARYLQRREKLYDKRSDFNFEWIASEYDLESNVIEAIQENKLEVNLKLVKTQKLQELQQIHHEINIGNIDVECFCESVELNINQLMERLKLDNRYELLNHPELHKAGLLVVLNAYIELFNKWFLNMDLYLQELLIKYSGWSSMHKKLNPNVSYSGFVRKYSAPTMWDMPKLEQLVEGVHV